MIKLGLNNEAGIYIHIPFCKQACNYCNFHFSTSLSYRERMVTCLIKELEIQKDFLKGKLIRSIYFGGGTPSVLNKEEVALILATIYQFYTIKLDVEITLEANPDDIDNDVLSAWYNGGVNRLSVGIQSIHDEELIWMNRAHSHIESVKTMEAIQSSLFSNYSLDLIFGSSLSSESRWMEGLQWVVAQNPNHISCYNLTVEPGTALFHQVKSGKSKSPDMGLSEKLFKTTHEFLTDHGYDHYEISSYGKPGFESVHNTGYWFNIPYLGIGPGAHSYKNGNRYWNITNNASYMTDIQKGEVPLTKEVLGIHDQFNEALMLGFRTKWGVAKTSVESFESKGIRYDKKSLKSWIEEGYIIDGKTHFILSMKGTLIADKISASLFAEE